MVFEGGGGGPEKNCFASTRLSHFYGDGDGGGLRLTRRSTCA
jgi:hypothetical protein